MTAKQDALKRGVPGPGAWEAPGKDGHSFPICTQRRYGKRRSVAHAYTQSHAYLISAAPDLLAALKLALPLLSGHQETSERKERYKAACAAIAKADGR